MIPASPLPRYRAYLLRLWEERGQRPGAPRAWRFSLEDPHTGERLGFASLEQLTEFLAVQMAERPGERAS